MNERRWTHESARTPEGKFNAAWDAMRMEVRPPTRTSSRPMLDLRVGRITGKSCMNQWMAKWARVMKPRSRRRSRPNRPTAA